MRNRNELYGLISLKVVIIGVYRFSTRGLTKRDTRSLDYGSNQVTRLPM